MVDGVTVDTLGEADALLTVAATVVNEGDGPVVGLLVQFADVGFGGGTAGEVGPAALRGLQQLSDLPAGSATTMRYSFILPGGATTLDPRRLAVTVDPYDAVAEADEGDNIALVDVDVPALLVDAGVAVAVEE